MFVGSQECLQSQECLRSQDCLQIFEFAFTPYRQHCCILAQHNNCCSHILAQQVFQNFKKIKRENFTEN